MRPGPLLLALLASGVLTASSDAQRIERAPRSLVLTRDANRAVLGVSTSSSGPRDTLGLLITAITPGGPAERAGLEEGNRIASINGVNLTLSAADAGEPDMRGLVTRRLSRELGKVEPGADVELRVWANGQYRTIRVKTVSPSDLPGRERLTRAEAVAARGQRAAVGVNVSASGTVRDTLGILVIRVTPGGPAERAGLVEGNRIASINGVDVRVPRADATDRHAASARVNRFRRELRKLEPGNDAELRVWADGQYRTIRVRTTSASELSQDDGWSFIISDGADHMFAPFGELAPMPPMPPRPTMPSVAPFIERFQFHDGVDEILELPGEEATAPPASIRVSPGTPPARATAVSAGRPWVAAAPAVAFSTPTVVFGWDEDDDRYERRLGYAGSVISASGSGERYVLTLPGLRLAKVNHDLASYFGPDSDQGLLVLEADRRWGGLRPGDVLLSVNGAAVRSGDRSSISIDLDQDNRLEVLRRGTRRTVKLP